MKFIVLTLTLVLWALVPNATKAYGSLNQPQAAAIVATVDVAGVHKHLVQGDPETREYLIAQAWPCKDGQRAVCGYSVKVLPPAETSPYKQFLDPDASVDLSVPSQATFSGSVIYNQHATSYSLAVRIDPSPTFVLDVKDAADGTVLLHREGAYEHPRRGVTISVQ